MVTLDNRFGKNISLWVEYENTLDNDFKCTQQLCRFRKKQTELVEALLHIIDEAHKSNNLHNDIFHDNILLHFPVEESRVYIKICDLGMATKSTN
jgi:serine/threonine protein kinase